MKKIALSLIFTLSAGLATAEGVPSAPEMPVTDNESNHGNSVHEPDSERFSSLPQTEETAPAVVLQPKEELLIVHESTEAAHPFIF